MADILGKIWRRPLLSPKLPPRRTSRPTPQRRNTYTRPRHPSWRTVMAPSGLPDDPVVIDDHMENTKESFIEMRQKLIALQREIQEVIERQEEEIRRQEEKELNDYCRSHHILIMNKEEEEEHVVRNPLKRSRSASSPPPLIPIHEVSIDEEEDAMDFLQMSMAHDSKRLKRTGRSPQHRDWAVMHAAGAKVEPIHEDEDDEVEIVDEVIGGGNVRGEETAAKAAAGGGCMRHEISNLGGNLFTKVEIVWPKETGRGVKAPEIVDHNEGPNDNRIETGIDTRGKHFGGVVKEGFDPVQHGDDSGNVGRGEGNEPVNCNINTDSEDDIEIINEIIKEANSKERAPEEEEEGNDTMMEESEEEMDLMKEKMRAFQEKKKQYWEIQDKANRIIDSTRARAKFDQQADNEPTEADKECGDAVEPNGEGHGEEEEEDLVYGDGNFEYKDNGCEDTNDEEMATNDEGRKDGIETPVIPMELLNEVETLNNMKQGGTLERWSGKEMMLQGCQDASRNVAIWKKIGAIFIVNKFFEFLEERGYHMSVTRNMVAAC